MVVDGVVIRVQEDDDLIEDREAHVVAAIVTVDLDRRMCPNLTHVNTR